MFKKPVVRQSRTLLKSSAARAVRESVASTFPLLTAADLLLLFPPKSSLIQDKLSHPSGVTLYSLDPSHPLFFSIPTPPLPSPSASPSPSPPPSPTTLLPTVYALWLCPHLLPPLFIHSLTSPHLLRGADLMLPGILHPPSLLPLHLSPYQVRSVIVRGNPAPIGVGVMVVGDEEVARKGWVGRGMKLVHVVGDELWAGGEKGLANEGFKEGRVEAVVGGEEEEVRRMVERGMEEAARRGEALDDWEKLKAQVDGKFGGQDKDEVKTEKREEMHHAEGGMPDVGGGTGTAQAADEQQPQPVDATHDAEKVTTDEATAPVQEGTVAVAEDAGAAPSAEVGTQVVRDSDDSAEEDEGGDEPRVSAAVMDASLLESLLYAIKTRLSDELFPLTPSVLLSSHMEACNPHPHRLDLKASSHKKMAKFIKAMQKRALLFTKAAKGEVVVTGVHRDHPEVRALPLTTEYEQALRSKTKAREKAERERERRRVEEEEKEAGHARAAGAILPERLLSIHYAYKPDALLRPLLFDGDDELVSMRDAKQRLADHLREEALDQGTSVTLTPDLATLLPPTFPRSSSTIPKAALAKALEAHLSLYHAISLTPNPPPTSLKWHKGDPPPVSLSLESRQGKKVMTRIHGLERYGVEPDAWAREAQRLFASSATTAEGLGKKGGKPSVDVLVQGDWRDGVAEKLTALHHIPSRLIVRERSG